MPDITILAAWGEFLGGIAVVVSLVYLASQIRSNTRMLQVSTTVAYGETDMEISKLIIADPEVGRIFREGAADRESLTVAERNRFDDLLAMATRQFQRTYFVAQEGAMKPAIWQGAKKGHGWVLQQRGSQQWWKESRFFFSDEFAEFVDGLIREGEAAA
jgi:hypothetical protein